MKLNKTCLITLFGLGLLYSSNVSIAGTISNSNPVVNEQYSDTVEFVTDLFDIQRVTRIEETPLSVIKKGYSVLHGKKNATLEEKYKAVMDLRYVYKYCFKDDEKAEEVLSYLTNVKGMKNKLRAEILISKINEDNVLDEDNYEELLFLSNKSGLFPYDNGYMPVFTKDLVDIILATKQCLDGKGRINSDLEFNCWNQIPASIIYSIATDKKEYAYKSYQAIKEKFDKKTDCLVSDFLQPLYMRVKPANRKFLAGVLCAEVFPNQAIRLINESLTDSSRVSKPEHAFAVLYDLYRRHMAVAESDRVWQILNKYYPNSIWLK